MMTKDQLLSEVDDILRSMPPRDAFGQGNDDVIAWVGRAAAAIERWDRARAPSCLVAVGKLNQFGILNVVEGLSSLKSLLHQARADLRMEVGALSLVISSGQVFDYFDEVRKVIETARSEVFFVDPYLDAEFVSRYLPQVTNGVAVRLLGGPQRMTALLPAVDSFATQSRTSIAVRSSDQFHDRFLFTDRATCYLSGASFKDGAKKAPAVLTQITDGFSGMWTTYEGLWNSGKVER